MSEKTTLEVGGLKFTGGKLFLVLTILSTLAGAAWGGFEFYNDYRNMKAKIERYVAPDLSGIRSELAVVNTKLDEALEYSKDIKNGLRDDIVRLERIVDAVEDDVNKVEDKTRELITLADQRFENKRDQLLTDYEQKADSLRTSTDLKLKELEGRLNKRLQRALDNPLAQ
ncbi:hypothetical protein N9E03_00765 [bacterium]|nr:hypothetical protein [bacterium]|tara:strand:- start:35 stop:544 length:510 start_codon:yes stop_codon:yes gene_type:complete